MKYLFNLLKQLFCIHKYGDWVCGGIAYNYRECLKCNHIQNKH